MAIQRGGCSDAPRWLFLLQLDGLIEQIEQHPVSRPLEDESIFDDWQVTYVSTARAPRQEGQRDRLPPPPCHPSFLPHVLDKHCHTCLSRQLTGEMLTCSGGRALPGPHRTAALPTDRAVPISTETQHHHQQGSCSPRFPPLPEAKAKLQADSAWMGNSFVVAGLCCINIRQRHDFRHADCSWDSPCWVSFTAASACGGRSRQLETQQTR